MSGVLVQGQGLWVLSISWDRVRGGGDIAKVLVEGSFVAGKTREHSLS